MAYQHAVADHRESYAELATCNISTREVFDLSARDLADFNEKPGHLTFLTPIYPFVVSGLARLTFGYDMPPLPLSLRPDSRSSAPYRPIVFIVANEAFRTTSSGFERDDKDGQRPAPRARRQAEVRER